MITYHRTSILASQAQTVVNTVNTVGVMGKGLASQFKARYPEMYSEYRNYCKNGKLDVGKLWLWKGDTQWVLNFPTKKHWRNPSKMEYIEEGLKKFVSQYEKRGIVEIAFPRLGCGNGGLVWSDVKPLTEEYLSQLPISIYIHDFEKDIGLPEHRESMFEDKLLSPKAIKFQERTFDAFISSINESVCKNKGLFSTLKRGSVFKAEMDHDSNINIITSKEIRKVMSEDIYEVWDMLLKGPVSKDQLSGSAWDSAYLLFSMLSQMPSIRAIRIASKHGDETLAVVLLRDTTVEKVSSDNNGVHAK